MPSFGEISLSVAKDSIIFMDFVTFNLPRSVYILSNKQNLINLLCNVGKYSMITFGPVSILFGGFGCVAFTAKAVPVSSDGSFGRLIIFTDTIHYAIFFS